ncbi:NAD(P)H-binding protein [Corynebacterium sp. 13CS0277]|uniref:NAD(P)H-binding protein n=1 Tax=Corynebacterium sp. 13CS0277 TaxID=2071994 RepID=UPI001304EC30|nr:NAD(P)H-binding protein [Corynebacterium sp. 13CS0277]
MTQTVLIFGAHGRVARLATPLLAERGCKVLGVIRQPAHAEDVRADGAEPMLVDALSMNVDELAALMEPADVVVWSAGAAGRGGAEMTMAVDRDLALRVAEAAARTGTRLIMVSFVRMAVPAEHPLRTYSVAKRAADAGIRDLGYHEGLRYVILGPTALSDEPATGIAVIAEGDTAAAATPTSRALVAQVIAHYALQDDLPCVTVDFSDGVQATAEVLP